MPPAQDVPHMVHCALAGRTSGPSSKGKRGNHDTFKQRTFRPNPGQHKDDIAEKGVARLAAKLQTVHVSVDHYNVHAVASPTENTPLCPPVKSSERTDDVDHRAMRMLGPQDAYAPGRQRSN
jgi:hypothetical protein